MKFQAVVLVALAGVCAVNAAGIGRVARTSGRQLDGLTSNLPLIGGLTGGSAGGSGNLLGGLPLIGGLTGGSAGGSGDLLGGLPLIGGLTGGLTGGQGGLVGGLPLFGNLLGGGLLQNLPIISQLLGNGFLTGLTGNLPLVGGVTKNLPVVGGIAGREANVEGRQLNFFGGSESARLRNLCLSIPNPLPTQPSDSQIYDKLVELIRNNGRNVCYNLPSRAGLLSSVGQAVGDVAGAIFSPFGRPTIGIF